MNTVGSGPDVAEEGMRHYALLPFDTQHISLSRQLKVKYILDTLEIVSKGILGNADTQYVRHYAERGQRFQSKCELLPIVDPLSAS